MPQQSVTTFCSVADIEEFFRILHRQFGKIFLSAVDIPCTERWKAMRDLRIMGVTGASLFPDVDGACKGLREDIFREIW
jgi:hypothetical protein